MKAVAWIVLSVTLLVAGVYTIVSLARWEWNRALFFAIVFVAAEVLLVAGVVLARLAKVERELIATRGREPASLKALRATRGDQQRFA